MTISDSWTVSFGYGTKRHQEKGTESLKKCQQAYVCIKVLSWFAIAMFTVPDKQGLQFIHKWDKTWILHCYMENKNLFLRSVFGQFFCHPTFMFTWMLILYYTVIENLLSKKIFKQCFIIGRGSYPCESWFGITMYLGIVSLVILHCLRFSYECSTLMWQTLALQ